MSDMNRRWRLNETEVAAKVIEGEAIILNVSSGMYYTLDGVGADIWEMLVRHCSFGEIVETVIRDHSAFAERIASDAEQLITNLLGEQLIVVADHISSPSADQTPSPSPSGEGYVPPELEKHTDMADLLALDPPMPGLMDGAWSDSAGHG